MMKLIPRKLLLSLKKNRSYSVFDALQFAGNFLVNYCIFFISIIIPLLISKPNDVSFTSFHVWIFLIVPFLLVVFTYIRENIITYKRERKIKQKKVIYTSITSIIKFLLQQDFKKEKDIKRRYVEKVLVLIQRIMQVILHDQGIPVGTICANLMLYHNPDKLVLEYCGVSTDGHGSEGFTLNINRDKPDIGAPEAFVTNSIRYIDNTTLDEYKNFFSDEENSDVKSFISIPLRDNSKSVYAVLNIDSDVIEQFINVDFIEKQVLPEIKVFVYLIKIIDLFGDN